MAREGEFTEALDRGWEPRFSKSRNYGLKGGWLDCMYWVAPGGKDGWDPTGLTRSAVVR